MIQIIGLFALISYSITLTCNSSSYEFTSIFSLGKQDELNRTFTKIQPLLTGLDFTYTFNTTNITYKILNFTANMKYIDTNQKQDLVEYVIIVQDGYLQLDFSFNWTKTISTNVTSGNASGTGRTNQIIFGKDLIINSEGFAVFNLYGLYKISWDIYKLSISRINPATVQADINALEQLLNGLPDQSEPLRDKWITGVNVLMDINLNDSLHQDYHKTDKEVNYTYQHPTRGQQQVTFLHDLMHVNLDRKGLGMGFSTVIKNYSDFQCGTFVPSTHRQTAQFGGIQEFMSLGVYNSTLRYALSKGYFDSVLNRDNWQSLHFQFYAGDLYDVIPAIQTQYYPRNELSGSCIAQTNGFTFGRGGTDSFNVTLNHNCTLYGNSTNKIVDIIVNSSLNIRAQSFKNYTNFVVNQAEFTAVYNTVAGYTVTNKDLADYYLNSTAHSLRGSKVFGSGLRAAARDYPHFEVNTDYVFIYDSANIHQETM